MTNPLPTAMVSGVSVPGTFPLVLLVVAGGMTMGVTARRLWDGSAAQRMPPPLGGLAEGGSEARAADATSLGAAASSGEEPPLTPAASAAAVNAILHSRSTARLEQLARLLPQADAAAVETLARHFCDPKTEEEGNLCLRLVLARWAELDPQGSVAFCRTINPFKGERAWLVSNAFEAWARTDYPAALAAADTPRNRLSALLGLSSADPLSAFAELENDRGLFQGTGDLPWGDLFARLAPLDPARAAALLNRMSPNYGYMVSQSVVGSWARKDPAAAAAWMAGRSAGSWQMAEMVRSWVRGAEGGGVALDTIADSLKPGPLRAALQAALLDAEAKRDLEGSLARTLALPKGFERQAALSALVRSASAKGDWRAVLKLGEELQWRGQGGQGLFAVSIQSGNHSMSSSGDYETRQAFATALRQKLAEGEDVASVWSAVTANTNNPLIEPEEVLKTWLAKDPEAAAKAVLTQSEGSRTRDYSEDLGRSWAALDPARAQHFWSTLPEDSPHRKSFLSGLATAQASRDPAAALQWAGTLPAASQAEARETVVSNWAARRPAEAVQAVLAQPALQANPAFIASLISNHSEQNPIVVAPLLACLPSDDTTETYGYAYHEFTKGYAAKDARAASEWVAAMPEGAVKDQSINGLVNHLSHVDPDFPSAFAWAGAVGDQSYREILANAVFTQWRSIDAAAAKAAIEQSTLPPETKKRLLSTP